MIPKDNYRDPDFCTDQLMHFWNVPIFKSGREIFKERMRQHEWDETQIKDMELKALNMSNWRKSSFSDMMLRNPKLFEEKPI
jgi:hypothetical protein